MRTTGTSYPCPMSQACQTAVKSTPLPAPLVALTCSLPRIIRLYTSAGVRTTHSLSPSTNTPRRRSSRMTRLTFSGLSRSLMTSLYICDQCVAWWRGVGGVLSAQLRPSPCPC
jgi:hypothetical protein